MNFMMEAFVQARTEEVATRIIEWDYHFSASDIEEAEGIASEIARAFDCHDDNGVKWVEGPYQS